MRLLSLVHHKVTAIRQGTQYKDLLPKMREKYVNDPLLVNTPQGNCSFQVIPTSAGIQSSSASLLSIMSSGRASVPVWTAEVIISTLFSGSSPEPVKNCNRRQMKGKLTKMDIFCSWRWTARNKIADSTLVKLLVQQMTVTYSNP